MTRFKTVTKSSLTESTNDGEVTNSVNTNSFQAEAEPPYVKLYLDDIARLNGLSPKTNAVLQAIVKYMNFRNEIILVAHNKRQISAELNTTMNTLNDCIKKLVKKGMLIRIDKSCYLVDPSLFGKGRWKDIKNLRLTIEYGEQGRTLISNVNKPLQPNLFDNVEEAKLSEGKEG